MSDISDKPRKFIVHASCNCAMAPGNYEIIEVDAGEDADVECAELLDHMIGNEFDTGWNQASDEDLKSMAKKGWPDGCAPWGSR